MNRGVARRSLTSMVAAYVGALSATCACTVTLDPSVLVNNGENGGGGEGGEGGNREEPLPSCPLLILAQTGQRYVVCPAPLDFHAATSDCTRRNGTLAQVGSDAENELIARGASLIVNSSVWLGGTRGDEAVWHWPDASVFWRGGRDGAAESNAFVRWAADEPSDSSALATGPEHCLALGSNSRDWSARACSLALPYVCEGN